VNDRREFLGTVAAGLTAATNALGQSGEIPRRTLGHTGQKVSCVGLGGSHIGNPQTVQESMRIVRSAIDNGINFMDNCWDYHDGRSEDWMGQGLSDGYRQKVFLMTKIDGQDRATAEKQINESLKRLRTDHIDLIQQHEVIRPTDPEKVFGKGGSIEALTAARKTGKIRYIGFTGHKDPHIHLAMLKTAEAHGFTFDTVQMPLNVMDAHFNSFTTLVVPELVRRNIGVLGMKPLGGGIILKSNTVSAEDCLRYALSLPTSVVISGCDSMDRLEQTLRVARGFQQLTQAQMNDILGKTQVAAKNGEFELYKTSNRFDGTIRNPQWLG